MLYGAMFVLGAAYALSKGVHIRADFIYRRWSVQDAGPRRHCALPHLLLPDDAHLPLGRRREWAWISVSRGERGTDTAWMPLLGPVKSCAADRHRVPASCRASPSC